MRSDPHASPPAAAPVAGGFPRHETLWVYPPGMRRWTVADYLKLDELGLLEPPEGHESTELLDGVVRRAHSGAARPSGGSRSPCRCPPDMKPWTWRECSTMADGGVFADGEHVELVDGVVFGEILGSPRHDALVNGIAEALREATERPLRVRVNSTVGLAEEDYPKPDVALPQRRPHGCRPHGCRPHGCRPHGCRTVHPAPADSLLYVEVADSSLRRDCIVKLPRYRLFGVPEVWIVDVYGRRVERHFSTWPAARTTPPSCWATTPSAAPRCRTWP